MAFKTLGEELPGIYKLLLPDFTGKEIFQESFATCSDCAMVCKDKKNVASLAMRPFLPDKKCCTFHPTLPNYLVGAILSDEDVNIQNGRIRILEKIKNKVGITPSGISAPPLYQVLYDNGSNLGFGNSAGLLCPYFNTTGTNCSIWKYRDTICSTYFCKTMAGQKGKSFWQAVKLYLAHIQDSLIKFCLYESGLQNWSELSLKTANTKIENLTATEIDNLPVPPEEYAKIWEQYEGKETDFYISCYNKIKTLTHAGIQKLGGIQEQVLFNDFEKKRLQMMSLPTHLKLNKQSQLTKTGDDYEVKLSGIDTSITLPALTIDIFDGNKSVSEISAHLDTTHNIEIDNDLISVLYNYDILSDAET